MNFRLLLLPFSWIYNVITAIRNSLYDNGIFKSTRFDFPVICIGNLSTGGTGKSPTTNYIIDVLKHEYTIAVLSRGYGRLTRGFVLATEQSTAEQIGDEPLMYFKKHHQNFSNPAHENRHELKIAVCENRILGINQLKNNFPGIEIILLDDAFQHRAVAAGLNILVTDYANLYCNDLLLPAGNLRESRTGAKRAHIIIVSKCPDNLNQKEKELVTTQLKTTSSQVVYFSHIRYQPLLNVLNELNNEGNSWDDYTALLLTGIAKPKALSNYLSKQFKEIVHLDFADHHNFTVEDLNGARKKFDNIANHKKIIITTEKDWMRLQDAKLKIVINDLPVYIQPVKFEFNDDDRVNFNQYLVNYVRKNKTIS